MDIWNLHTKALAFGHMGSVKIKSFFISKLAQKRPKFPKWSNTYQNASPIIHTFTEQYSKNITNANILNG